MERSSLIERKHELHAQITLAQRKLDSLQQQVERWSHAKAKATLSTRNGRYRRCLQRLQYRWQHRRYLRRTQQLQRRVEELMASEYALRQSIDRSR